MLRYNTSFLFKATAVWSIGCLPMALAWPNGMVVSAFAIPLGLTVLAAAQIRKHGQYELRFHKLSKSVYEIQTTGGRQGRWLIQNRFFLAGVAMVFTLGMATLLVTENVTSKSVVATGIAVFALCAFAYSCCSVRRLILADDRRFVTEYLIFGKVGYWRWCWQVRDGDYLAVFTKFLDNRDPGDFYDFGPTQEFSYRHTLYVCRSRLRQAIAIGYFSNTKRISGMETAAKQVANQVQMPYDGYREDKGFWWPF